MNTPKIRFKEFNDEWKKEKFKQFSYYSGKRNKNNLNLIPYAITNINGFVPQTEAHNEFGYMKNTNRKAYNIVTPNSFAYNPARINVGSIGYYNGNKDIIVSSLYEVFKTTNYIDDKFLWFWLKSSKLPIWINKLQEGSVRQYFYYDKLCETPLYFPSVNEQKKISKFLSLLDKKIELQSKKIEDLKLFKKGLHDKLFNEVTGNDYLLSDIAVFENGKGHENIVDENGKYILINSKFISTGGNVTKKCSEQLTPLFKNDITMVMSDLPNGKALAKCYYIDENNKYSLNQRICKIKVKDAGTVNSKYLFYLLDRNPYYLRFDDGVNQTNLKKDDILSLNLVLPSIKDQERDSKTLTIIDNIIEKENNKLSKLNLLKKGLMQSMFV